MPYRSFWPSAPDRGQSPFCSAAKCHTRFPVLPPYNPSRSRKQGLASQHDENGMDLTPTPMAHSRQLRIDGARMLVIALVSAGHLATWLCWRSPAPQPAQNAPGFSITLSQDSPAPGRMSPSPTRSRPLRSASPASPGVEGSAHSSSGVQAAAASAPAAAGEAAPLAAAPVAVAAPPLSTAPEADEPVAYLDHPLDYPPQARRQGQQGRLMLRVQVLADGRCGELELLQSSGYDTLDRAALESVRNWRFVPAQRNGQAYSAWFRVPIRFSLRDA